jgi:pimeloyl-ACP methyl ester carboxylesterase
VVLVGHSLGGLFATLYADKFESNVAGLVLVDPSFSGQFDYVLSQQDKQAIFQDGDQWVSLMQTCKKLAQEDSLSNNDSHNCFHPPSNLTPKETDYVTRQFYRPSYYASLLSEFENFSPIKGTVLDGDQERRLERSFGDLPFEVLTAGLTWGNATVSEAGKKAITDVWKRGHDKLVQRSTRGISITIPDSGHFIQLNQPERVVAAIRKVVLDSRQ